MDLTGPLIESQGYLYILTFIDHFTKWIETRPLKTKNANDVATGIFSIYCRQGAPVQIVSDNGTEFTNNISKALQEIHGCRLIFSAPYHPQTNGLVESTHKAIKGSLIRSMNDKREDWSYYLEQVTYSINIRPRETTDYSAFELMHGCRKPRLPFEAESLSFLYPDVNLGETSDENDDNNDLDDLIQAMKRDQQESFQHAGESLINSKKIMKRQYDKKVNPITTKFAVDDDVLIENMCRKKSKGGKLQDKWIGPYPIKEVSRSTVQVCKDKALIRVKKAKAKLWRSIPDYNNTFPSKRIKKVPENRDLSFNEDDSPTSIPFEVSEMVPTSQEQENDTQRQEVIQRLLLMKEDVIKSIQKDTPLSPLHNELLKRCHMPYNELFDWRMQHYPSTYEGNNAITDYDINLELSEILNNWYLESHDVKIPFYQYTNEEFDFSSYWERRSTDYSTKILLPVIQQLLSKPFQYETLDAKVQGINCSSESLEEYCAAWGGEYNGIRFVNTCPVDNFITLFSLHLQTLLSSVKLTSAISPNIEIIFQMVNTKNFNQLKYWFATKLGLQLVDSQYDFLGYEGKVVELLDGIHLCPNLYAVEFQCWSCCCISEKRLNLSSIYKFQQNCQTTIDHQIDQSYKCLKCRDTHANVEKISTQFLKIPSIIILEVGHIQTENTICHNQVEDNLNIDHMNKLLQYSLFGYTIHAGLHFLMRTKIQGCWYIYDGLENQKLTQREADKPIKLGQINCIFYILTDVTQKE